MKKPAPKYEWFGPRDCRWRYGDGDWVGSVTRIYEKKNVAGFIPMDHVKDEEAWLWRALKRERAKNRRAK